MDAARERLERLRPGRPEQRKMPPCPREGQRQRLIQGLDAGQCPHHAQHAAVGCTEAVLLRLQRRHVQGIRGTGAPVRRAGPACERGMQPALRLRTAQVHARCLPHGSGMGQHQMLLPGQGRLQIGTAALCPCLDCRIGCACSGRRTSGQFRQGGLPVHGMHGQRLWLKSRHHGIHLLHSTIRTSCTGPRACTTRYRPGGMGAQG